MQTLLLIGLFFCHLLADFTPLSNSWMLKAKQKGKPLFPIFIHALVHAGLMAVFLFLILEFNLYNLVLLFNIQLFTHFFIDVIKGRMNEWFPVLQSSENKWHWIIFGLDQYFHALVIIAMSHYACNF
jgi:hypothetical protein